MKGVVVAKKKNKRKRPGPKPTALKIKGNWEDAAKTAVKKRKPQEGSRTGQKRANCELKTRIPINSTHNPFVR
jgi:hypothetical protein